MDRNLFPPPHLGIDGRSLHNIQQGINGNVRRQAEDVDVFMHHMMEQIEQNPGAALVDPRHRENHLDQLINRQYGRGYPHPGPLNPPAAVHPPGPVNAHAEAPMNSPGPANPHCNRLSATVQALLNDWRKCLENDETADFTIKCGSETIKAHSLVLGVRSPVFKAMLQHDTVEHKNHEVTIDDTEPDTLLTMIQYMYWSKLELDDLGFDKVCQLTTAADKYGLIELKDACLEHLFMDINLQNAGALLILVRRHPGPKKFLKKALEFCSENFTGLRKDLEFKEVMKECFDEFFDPENN